MIIPDRNDSSGDSTPPEHSPREISRLLGYKGHIGQERKKWCEDFITWKRGQLAKITTEQKRIMKAKGRTSTCSKGCCFCCSQHISASLQECDAIVYWLSHHEDVQDAFLKRYASWRKSFSDHSDHEVVFNRVNQAEAASKSQPGNEAAFRVLQEMSEAYLQLDIQCPFLDNGGCSIYPVRPFVCATMVVISPPEFCKASSDSLPVMLMGGPEADPERSYFRGTDYILLANAPLVVNQIIGEAISIWLVFLV